MMMLFDVNNITRTMAHHIELYSVLSMFTPQHSTSNNFFSDEELEKVRNFEKSYDSLVYHVIKGSYIMSDGSIMECMDMLYVSEDEYEWSLDRKDIKKDKCTYVYAVSNFCDGEFGMLKVIPVNGGIIRDTHGF